MHRCARDPPRAPSEVNPCLPRPAIFGSGLFFDRPGAGGAGAPTTPIDRPASGGPPRGQQQ
eukprot:10317009-Alexandrium_andersonii.AAC.1